MRGGRAWTARVFRGDWDGHSFELGGIFRTEEEGVAWCEKMAKVLARDRRDDSADSSDGA
ncbi:hypothetical protein P12x_003476 [Tundrisphaera lichenicola]|uniref:hypothetical protein n=1 Tax=Tundrisphaera lichenicola TaxID=2029860 RepID=UPI003EBF815A